MASSGSSYVWTRLTRRQVQALLAVAAVADHYPESLPVFLPEVGQRAAFRGAVTELERLEVGPASGAEPDMAAEPQPVFLAVRRGMPDDVAGLVRRAWGLTVSGSRP